LQLIGVLRSRAATLLLLCAWQPPLSFDISWRSAANPPHAALAVE